MDNDRFARYGAATGIIAVVLILIGFSIFGSGLPSTDASSQDWGSFFTDHQSRIQLGITIVGAGLFFFIWFLGSLRSAIAAAEGGTGRLASIAFGGGLVGVVALLIAVTGAAAAAFHPDQVDPTITRALNDFGTVAAAPGARSGCSFALVSTRPDVPCGNSKSPCGRPSSLRTSARIASRLAA